MNETPKIPKGRARCSLSLKKRRNDAVSSPQNNTASPTEKTPLDSPKVALSTAQDFTPPHKKLNLDDSLDDSPMSDSYSPTSFLSQTYGSDSPEVFWNWEKDNAKLDSGFLSSSSSTKTIPEPKLHYRPDPKRYEKQRREYINKRMERKREKDMKIRKSQRAQAELLLKERLAQLESQLKSIQTTSTSEQPQEERVSGFPENEPDKKNNLFEDIDNIFEQSCVDFEEPKPELAEKPQNDHLNGVDFFDDFFNDANTDDLLIEATQKLESVMPELKLTQTVLRTETNWDNHPSTTSKAKTQTPNRNKRSSLYMEFLEDDGDDFFVSLDDDWLRKATQPSKTRSPFQRYKSMPTATATSAITSTTSSSVATVESSKTSKSSHKTAYPNGDLKKPLSNALNAPSSSYKTNTIRRHASSHAMSPSSTNYRGRQQPSRN